jgi:5-methylcytosine-specific restriction enzyme A
MTIDFEVGKIYDRRKDIHSRFGGQQQGGIATSSQTPVIFLFTGESGKQYGYEDDWGKDGVFLYTGEGQLGDMQFIRGNKAVRDHVPDGKDLLLFRSLGKSKGYRYLGEFTCNSWEYQIRPDLKGQMRKAIVFHLVLPSADALPSMEEVTVARNLKQLREEAQAAGTEATEALSKEARRLYYQRSAIVRAYVLARAAGRCESCLQSAPFLRPDGTPYLEPHHTRRLSDGGPDNPISVAAICPNCHRRIHHGRDGLEVNQALQGYLIGVEERME